MIPAPFDYHRATSVEEALKALAEDDTQALAGGHSLIPTMKLRLNQPGKLIDISQIESLRGIRLEGDHLIIGAATTHGEIATSDLVREHAPWIAAAAEGIGDIAVRNRGTIGGSLAHADPAADWPAVLIAGKCFCEVAGATSESKENGGGRTKHKAEEFFTGFYETALEEGQLITAVHVPVLKANQRGVYSKFPQPASRYAIVGAAAVLDHRRRHDHRSQRCRHRAYGECLPAGWGRGSPPRPTGRRRHRPRRRR